jgi:hypothetical protein
MPSTARPLRDRRTWSDSRAASIVALALLAAATIAARLPFLLRGPRFFDSDEAVEGLMARHVLTGEYPMFLWGQRYKGVPEVYLTAAAFHWWPASSVSVVALKAVTLGCFAVFVCLNFWLLTRLFTRRIAWIATAFLIVGPPSLVFWSLTGSAEIVMSFIAGTSLCLGLDAWRRTRSIGSTGSRAGLVVAAAALGFGLWVQQYILYYVISLAVAAIDWTPQGREQIRELIAARRQPAWLRLATRVLAIAAAVYIVLGVVAFFGAGFGVTLFGVEITITHPQKMWWIAAALLLISAAALMVGRLMSRNGVWIAWLAPALGFLLGYAPALVGRLAADGPGAPMARMDLGRLRSSLSPLVRLALPIVFGFKSPTTQRLAVPAWPALIIAIVIVVSYVGSRWAGRAEQGRAFTPLFHIFLIVTPIVFLVSGSYIDAQSYRYLMPIHAALTVVYAVGIDRVYRWNRIAGVTLLTSLLALFAVQQADWYRRLEPDREAMAIVSCLDRSGIRAAYADYWLGYKLTFLTGERVIVAPVNGVDRYPPYTAIVREQPSAPTIDRPPNGSTEPVACQSIIHRDPSR